MTALLCFDGEAEVLKDLDRTGFTAFEVAGREFLASRELVCCSEFLAVYL
jgi:hypothetical protein